MPEYSAEKDAHGLRKCFPKSGWLSGGVYCAVHGRGAGWPCKVGTDPRVFPPGVTACERCLRLGCQGECARPVPPGWTEEGRGV